jgi:lipoate-protein ligase A
LDPARFLNSGAMDGAANMELDARLLEEGLPVLRIYSWAKPTLSLGYFQKLEDVADPAFMKLRGVDCVMRPTGGGAILHHDELTFSLVLPQGHPALKGSINDSYLALTRPLLELLQSQGVKASFRGDCKSLKTPNCFAGSACPDLLVDGKKVFGSAQRRKDHAVLIHGSLLFQVDETLWNGVFGAKIGHGFAGIGVLNLDWPELLKKSYFEALNLI